MPVVGVTVEEGRRACWNIDPSPTFVRRLDKLDRTVLAVHEPGFTEMGLVVGNSFCSAKTGVSMRSETEFFFFAGPSRASWWVKQSRPAIKRISCRLDRGFIIRHCVPWESPRIGWGHSSSPLERIRSWRTLRSGRFFLASTWQFPERFILRRVLHRSSGDRRGGSGTNYSNKFDGNPRHRPKLSRTG